MATVSISRRVHERASARRAARARADYWRNAGKVAFAALAAIPALGAAIAFGAMHGHYLATFTFGS